MKRVLALLLTLVTVLTVLAVPSAATLPDPDEEPPLPPPPTPPPPGPDYSRRWAEVAADPGFQAAMAAAGEVQYETTMDGLRNLAAIELPAALAQSGSDSFAASELDALIQRLLDLLVMKEGDVTVPEPDSATANIGADDPLFCDGNRFRGDGLHASLPGPYGLFPPIDRNNFCMPYGPYDGNDLCSFVPDRTYVFDFRRACYQHDMGYFWTPFPNDQRWRIDNQFFSDMVNDCQALHPWYSLRRYGCFLVAGVYWLGVTLGGGPGYADREEIPGYSRPLNAGETRETFRPFVLPGNSTCGQLTHAWVAHSWSPLIPWQPVIGLPPPPTVTSVLRGTTLYPTGVVAAGTRVSFHFVRPETGQIVYRHVTEPSRLNCVVHHEDERFPTSNLAPGRVDVYATYTRSDPDGIEDVRVLVHAIQVV